METAVEIRGLVKMFGDFRAVDGLDLTVRRGNPTDIVGLVLWDRREPA